VEFAVGIERMRGLRLARSEGRARMVACVFLHPLERLPDLVQLRALAFLGRDRRALAFDGAACADQLERPRRVRVTVDRVVSVDRSRCEHVDS